MKRKAIFRGLLGFPLGVAIGHIFSVLGSLLFGDGGFYPCSPQLISYAGNEINAVILQTILCGVVGVSFSAGSVVWEAEAWSILKQTGVYFLINAFVMLPTAYLLNWMEHSVGGFIIYFGIFILYFALIWVIQYFAWKQAVKKMNEKLRKITGNQKL